jgi:hypothetical protein
LLSIILMHRGVAIRIPMGFFCIEVCRNALRFGADSVLVVGEPDPLGRQGCGGAMAQLRHRSCLFNFVGSLFGELADGDRPGHVRLPGAADRFYTQMAIDQGTFALPARPTVLYVDSSSGSMVLEAKATRARPSCPLHMSAEMTCRIIATQLCDDFEAQIRVTNEG